MKKSSVYLILGCLIISIAFFSFTRKIAIDSQDNIASVYEKDSNKKSMLQTVNLYKMTDEELSSFFLNNNTDDILDTLSSMESDAKVVALSNGTFLFGGVSTIQTATGTEYNIDAEKDVNATRIKEMKDLIENRRFAIDSMAK